MRSFTATYSPDDNKLRLSAVSRLEPELYARVKAAGFRWAPKQELFVAPMWTPEREDLLLELAGVIDDEDTTLVDRAEDRAERFEGYQEKRLGEAESARKAVDAIADGIPLGQPILVGHHSEKHARRDAERIRSGMERAVRLWDTAQYWKSRALGALRHAKYKERPAVRHRRIKTLGADKRRVERQVSALLGWRTFWLAEDLTVEKALRNLRSSYEPLSEHIEKKLEDGSLRLADYAPTRVAAYDTAIEKLERWVAHYDNRIAYETAMLDEQIGTGELGQGMAGRFDVAIGGQVFVRDEWCVILKVNKGADGNVSSVTTTAPRVVTWTSKWNVGIEKIGDYRPPSAEDVARVKKATALPPLCNYRGEGFKEMTEAEWKRVSRSSDMSHIRPINATPTAGRHRARFTMLPGWKRVQVFVTDLKTVNPPKPEPEPKDERAEKDQVEETAQESLGAEGQEVADAGREVSTPAINLGDLVTYEGGDPAPEIVVAQMTTEQADVIFGGPLDLAPVVAPRHMVGSMVKLVSELSQPTYSTNLGSIVIDKKPVGDAFEAMRKAAKDGVEVVVVRNLFPTPAPVADRVVKLLCIQPGDRVLEPSAGTGQLIDAIARAGAEPVTIDAVEVNQALAQNLIQRAPYPYLFVRCGDFLEMNAGHLGDIGRFDKILMNPPFENGVDIKHVEHALTMLKPWGRLVAIMAEGPCQKEWAEANAAHVESLPPGTFEGTQVRAMIVVIE